MKTTNAPTIFNRISVKGLLILVGLVILHISKQPVNGYYLCIVMDLYSRKIISWNISEKLDVIWSCLYSKELIKNEPLHSVSCFILTGGHNILHLHFGSYWILFMLCCNFSRKDILSVVPAVNVSSSILKRRS